MKQSNIQHKVVVIFILAIISILAAGSIAWTSLERMLGRINTLAEPDQRLELLNEVHSNISRLNQAYRSYSFSNEVLGSENQKKIVVNVKNKIDTLRQLNRADGYEMKELDSIYFLLDEIERGTLKLTEARKNNTLRNKPSRILKELSDQIETFKGMDSSYVVKNITSEILISDYTLQKLDSLSRAGSMGENAGFFRKLSRVFVRKRNNEMKDTLVLVPEKRIDTLTKVSVDTVNVMSNEAMLLSLQEYLQEVYQKEITSLHRYNDLEKSIQQKNVILLNTTEELVSDLREEERLRATDMARQAYQASGRFTRRLFIIILFFVASGILLLYLLLRDIRKTRYYQQQLWLEKEKADREAKVRQHFLATMSHEIRTPLTSLIGYADLLENNNEYHQAIKKSSAHMLHIANEILDLAKIESGIIEIHSEPVSLPGMFEDMRRSFEMKIKQKGLESIFEFPSDKDLVVFTDPYRFNQILYNLLHNAVKFTDSGFIKFSAVRQDIPNGNIDLTIRIEDSGTGILPEDHERIFIDYQQAGTHADKQKGSGLGLGVVKKVVNLLGGVITLESQPGKGSVFSMVFRLSLCEPKTELPLPIYTPKLFKDRSILIIDDDPLIVKLHSIILRANGATVVTCTNPVNSVEIISRQKFDLAIVDIQMPGVTGYELLDKFSEMKSRPERIIASTANVLLSHQDKEKLKNFDALLFKPVRKIDLIQLVAAQLNIPLVHGGNIQQEQIPSGSTSPEVSYNLIDLKKFTMGDEMLLKDVLCQLYTENKSELIQAGDELKKKNYDAVAGIIHKLATRFSQIQAAHSVDRILYAEESLRKRENISVKEINILLKEWEDINELMKEEHQL